MSTALDDIVEDTDTVLQDSDDKDWCDEQSYDLFPGLAKPQHEEARVEDQKKAE